MEPVLYVFIAAGALVVIATAIVLVRFANRSPPIASASVAPTGRFGLQLPPVQGPVEVWIRYTVTFPFHKPFGLETSKTFCLVLDLAADGQRMVFGHGGRHPAGLLEVEGIAQYMTSFSPGSESRPSRYTATTMVKRLSHCPRLLEGMVQTDHGTVLVDAQIHVEKA